MPWNKVRLSQRGEEYAVKFPPACAYCGAPAEAYQSLQIILPGSGGWFARKYKTSNLQIPYCQEHLHQSTQARKVLRISLAISILVGLALGIYSIVAASSGSDTMLCFVIILPGLLVFGLAFLLAIYILFAGAALIYPPIRHMPLPNQNGDLGIRVEPHNHPPHMEFRIMNEEFAGKFSSLNQ